ncbi:MAG: ribosome small subunit-dependent GTPase A, partial [Ilumatobacteraceae bacterium]
MSVDAVELAELGWDTEWEAAWRDVGARGLPGRVARLDRGWSTILPGTESSGPRRVRNVGADVAVGDWVVPSIERVEHVLPRRSAFVR